MHHGQFASMCNSSGECHPCYRSSSASLDAAIAGMTCTEAFWHIQHLRCRSPAACNLVKVTCGHQPSLVHRLTKATSCSTLLQAWILPRQTPATECHIIFGPAAQTGSPVNSGCFRQAYHIRSGRPFWHGQHRYDVCKPACPGNGIYGLSALTPYSGQHFQ